MAAIQFTGLSSGLDTDSVVEAMLATEKSKIQAEKDEKTNLEWKQEKWKEVNEKINNFQSDYIDKLRFQSNFEKYKVKSSNPNITVTEGGTLPIGNHKLKILQKPMSPTALGEKFDGSNFKTYTSNGETKTLETINKNISFKDYGLLSEGQTTSFTINGNTIEIEATDSLSSLERKIRSADDSLNVNFDTKNERLFISSKETGAAAKLEISGVAGNDFLQKLGLKDISNNVGTAGKIEYNGIELDIEKTPIEINGLTIEINGDIDPQEEIAISVETDTEAIIDFISSFVDEYNKLISELNTLYSAPKVSTGQISDSDREAMTDKQIDEYEQKLKDSLLRRDSNLQAVISALRNSLQVTFPNNTFQSLSAIGITTGSYSENGKLYLDKDKLRKAINEDADAVKEIFTAKANSYDPTSKNGIGSQLNEAIGNLSKLIDGVKSYKSFYNDKITETEIKSLSSRIKELEKKYSEKQTRLYKKFANLEKNMSTINSQSASLTSMLG